MLVHRHPGALRSGKLLCVGYITLVFFPDVGGLSPSADMFLHMANTPTSDEVLQAVLVDGEPMQVFQTDQFTGYVTPDDELLVYHTAAAEDDITREAMSDAITAQANLLGYDLYEIVSSEELLFVKSRKIFPDQE